MQAQKLVKRKKKALSDNNKTLLASTCIDLADLYMEEGRYDEAITEYIIVADVYKEMGKLIDFARANRMIGEAYTHLREYDKALSFQQIYLNIAKEQNDKVEEQRALATIGHTHLTIYLDVVDNSDKSALKLAYKLFMKSLVVCESLAAVIKKREHKDMTARLLANLGIVEECQNNYKKGIELLEKSIAICKVHELFEQLERSYTLLGSLYVRTEEYDKALHQYNLAIEVAGRLKNKISLICSSLSAKGDILIKLADFRGAKIVLFKAYKLNTPIVNENENIKQNLKIVAAMCSAEDSLLATSDSDYKTKKQLYEKLGDGACALKNYSKAIEYYLKMLDAAKSNHESGSQLSPCYISLAETYRDNKQYDLAIKYFKEEYNCLIGNVKENISTLLNIIDCMEGAGKDVIEIESYFNQARKECIKINDKKLESKVLSRYIALLRKNEEILQADKLESELFKIGFINSESDSELSDEQNTPNIGDDISIGDITDVSDESDAENIPSFTRKRTKGLVVKRNNKGETQLHTACISGNSVLVKHLLEQGHPVNVRDNCGWLPIHEACICGHIDIVQMLIDKGANINDRGGTLCNGTSPLHDAATNGHLEIIQLLLNKNACTTSKNDMGEIPLQILKKWRLKSELEVDEEILYNKLIKRLEQDADKLGCSKHVTNDSNNFAFETNSELDLTSSTTKRHSSEAQNKSYGKSETSKVGSLRRNVSFDSDLDVKQSKRSSDDIFFSNRNTRVTDEYKEVMETMRYPHKDIIVEKKRKSDDNRRSAHIELEPGDDWLENDLDCGRQKKRKIVSDSVITTMGTRTTSLGSLSRRSSASLKSINSFNDDIELPNEFFDAEFNPNEVENVPLQEDIENFTFDSDDDFRPVLTNRNKKQTSLTQQGFTKYGSLTSTTCDKTKLLVGKAKHQTKLSNFGHTRSVTQTESKHSSVSSKYDNQSNISNNIFNNEPILSIDVDIDGKLYRVPVPASEIHSRTIKWLAEEAAKRYGKKESLKPTVELETKNGASLADDDVVSILFTPGATKAEEVHARILNWNLPPLSDRYKEACVLANIEPSNNLEKLLLESSTTLNLKNLGLKSELLAPFCKAINRQNNLHSLNLCGNVIDQCTIQLLCLSLASLDNLNTLNLSLNQLSCNSMECIADLLNQTSKPILENLVNLDLSFNALGDESFKFLAIVTRYLKLQNLNLMSVDYTKDIFNNIANRNIELCLDYVTNFNISYNGLSKEEIAKFLSWINPQQIEVLDISNNVNLEEGLTKEVVNWLQQKPEVFNLQSLNLCRCNVSDAEIFELLRTLQFASTFSTVNLSYNQHLTALSLRRLIQQSSLISLDLKGCENIFKYFEDCTDNTWSFTKLKLLKLSFDNTKHLSEKNTIINSWRCLYKDQSGVKQDLVGYLELYTLT